MDLAGQVCVITGAGAGIGRVLAVAYDAAGAEVVLAGRRPAPLHETAAMLTRTTRGAVVVECDQTIEDDCRRLIATALEHHGQVDVLLNNAAIPGTDQRVADMDLANWNETIATNVTGPMLLSREALSQAMIPAGRGNIQFLSSAAAKAVLPGKAHYAVAKLGLIPLAQTIAEEVGGHGIRVNTLVVGTVSGDLIDRYAQRVAREQGIDVDEVIGRLAAGAALRRLVAPEEVAATSLWLASESSSAITGQNINVTAGGEKR